MALFRSRGVRVEISASRASISSSERSFGASVFSLSDAIFSRLGTREWLVVLTFLETSCGFSEFVPIPFKTACRPTNTPHPNAIIANSVARMACFSGIDESIQIFQSTQQELFQNRTPNVGNLKEAGIKSSELLSAQNSNFEFRTCFDFGLRISDISSKLAWIELCATFLVLSAPVRTSRQR